MKAFLRYYVELPFPLDKVDEAIGRLPSEWIDHAAREAHGRAVELLCPSAGPKPPRVRLLTAVSAPQDDDHVIRRALQWVVTGESDRTTILRGDLELAELGPSRTQLALSAQYQPFAPCTNTDERMASQRLGESTLKAFVDRLGAYVKAALEAKSTKTGVVRLPSGGKPRISPA